MRKILNIIKFLFGISILAISHIGITFLLPYPFSYVNLILAILILLIYWREDGMVVWVAFILNYVIDIYSSSPFGLNLFSGTVAVLFAYWMYKNIFTNKSFLSVFSLGLITLILYRVLYIIVYKFVTLLNINFYFELNMSILFAYLIEIINTMFVLILFYFILRVLTNKFKPATVGQGIFRYEKK